MDAIENNMHNIIQSNSFWGTSDPKDCKLNLLAMEIKNLKDTTSTASDTEVIAATNCDDAILEA